MKSSDKIRVAVLFGGRSVEHEVSLQSAKNVIQYLDAERFDVIPIGIDKQGNWFLGNEVFQKSLADKTVPQLSNQNHAWFTPLSLNKTMEKQSSINLIKSHNEPVFDVVFPVVHGTFSEDGTLQGLLELANVPYVGCGVLSSAIGMDKDISKRLAMQANIPIVPFMVIKKAAWLAHPEKFLNEILARFELPLFIKPANIGSSIGISKVKEPDQLSTAINDAFRFDTKVLVEKALTILELEIAVLEGLGETDEPLVSVVGEIKPKHEFYTYDAKYVDEFGAELCIPANISKDVQQEAQRLAIQIFKTLECEGMARIDLFYDPVSQQLYFNEINTIPGFTKISMYPKLMEASGLSYPDLLTHLVKLAFKRFAHKSKLQCSYSD